MTEQINIKGIMEGERTRLTTRKEQLMAELDEIDAELARIDAYFGTTTGPSQITKLPQGDRHPRGFVQSTVLKTVAEHPQGLTAAQIIENLNPHGIAQKSIANALGALVQAKKIVSQGRGGKYHPAVAEVPTAPDQPSS